MEVVIHSVFVPPTFSCNFLLISRINLYLCDLVPSFSSHFLGLVLGFISALFYYALFSVFRVDCISLFLILP